MNDLRTAAQQALEALEDACGGRCNAEYNPCWQQEAAQALRAALEQPEQEPVALFTKYGPPTMRDRDFWSTGYATATARAIEAALKEKNHD